MISLYPIPTILEETKQNESSFFQVLRERLGLEVVAFSSARAAMVYGLRALGLDRMDEILVPPFLSHCVISALGKTAFPTMAPSERTKAILVYHQFGYPQRIEAIEQVASEKGWFVVNNCVNALFSAYQGKPIGLWGEFAILSFSKFYPCALGGGLVVRHEAIQNQIDQNYQELTSLHAQRAQQVHEALSLALQNLLGTEERFEVDAIYGILPELIAFPSQSHALLPGTTQEIEDDIEHRKRLFALVQTRFPENIPEISECDVAPFAIPVSGDADQLERLSVRIRERLQVDVPVLHFDFRRNMLNPDYKKALVIGCHSQWTEDLVSSICDIIENV